MFTSKMITLTQELFEAKYSSSQWNRDYSALMFIMNLSLGTDVLLQMRHVLMFSRFAVALLILKELVCNFIWTVCFYNKTNHMHNISNLFYFGTTHYMFRTVSPSIVSSLRLYIQHQVRYDAVCTVLDPWWWTERLSETCRVLFQNKINLRYCASGWFYYRNILRCTVLETSEMNCVYLLVYDTAVISQKILLTSWAIVIFSRITAEVSKYLSYLFYLFMYLFILFMVHLMHWPSNIFAHGTVLLATMNGSMFNPYPANVENMVIS
jgi:hypothetical protein